MQSIKCNIIPRGQLWVAHIEVRSWPSGSPRGRIDHQYRPLETALAVGVPAAVVAEELRRALHELVPRG